MEKFQYLRSFEMFVVFLAQVVTPYQSSRRGLQGSIQPRRYHVHNDRILRSRPYLQSDHPLGMWSQRDPYFWSLRRHNQLIYAQKLQWVRRDWFWGGSKQQGLTFVGYEVGCPCASSSQPPIWDRLLVGFLFSCFCILSFFLKVEEW